MVSHEDIRQWCRKFGQDYANRLRRRRPQPGDKWPAYGLIAQHFQPQRHLLSASDYRQEMRKRFESWAEITGTKRAA